MARRRFRRKDLKRPDQFVSTGRQALHWALANQRRLWQIAGAAAIVLVVVGVVAAMRTSRANESNADLAVALAALRAERYSEAAQQLSEVAERWESTPVGHIARLYAGNADLKADKPDAAVPLLEGASGVSDWPSYLQQQAEFALGAAFEREGKTPEALRHYEAAAAMEGPYTAMAILGAARCRAGMGEVDATRELYERFVREFPQAPEVEVVNAKLAALNRRFG